MAKRKLLLSCLLISIFVTGCSNGSVASKTKDLSNSKKEEEVSMTKYTKEDEQKFLKDAYKKGYKDIFNTEKGATTYIAAVIEINSANIKNEFGVVSKEEFFKEYSSIIYSSAENEDLVFDDINQKFENVAEVDEDMIALYSQKNEVTSKAFRAYACGVLDRAIKDMKSINENYIDKKVESVKSSDVPKENVKEMKEIFLERTSKYIALFEDMRKNFSMDPIDKSIVEASKKEFEEYYKKYEELMYITKPATGGMYTEEIYANLFYDKAYVLQK